MELHRHALHQGLVTLMQRNQDIHRLALIFERTKFTASAASIVLQVLESIGKSYPELDKRLGPTVFESKSEFIPLEAADIWTRT
jgi:hypothetical protein